MSGLTSPAASPVALPAKVAPPSVLASGVPSLSAFIDLMIGKIVVPAPAAKSGNSERQTDAATGKILPEKDKIDPALAWLFGAMPADTPPPVTAAVLAGKTPVMRGLDPKVAGTDIPTLPALPPGKTPPTVNQPQPDLPLPPAIDGVPITPAPKSFDPNVMIGPVAPLPVVLPVAVALPALFALGQSLDAREDDVKATPSASVTTLSQPVAVPVAPTGDAQRQALDLGRQDWPQKMIDHIEALRDNANANDTSIRLKPEALGRVDVSLRTHTDGAISVRFTAEQPTTRTLIADAAPQLAAAAEARGIRLSGTSVDLSGQGDQRPRPDVERQQNISNHLAASGDDDNHAVDDGRIA
ncbi:flagellar hook-length control protein FliK [Sphingomonas bacterium]|uniref:flagellar hook-length control protein FliK n=1 Tax=Sphingomonas bacterium TaxID=1895847 RepID=UPI00262AD277|nr:flagellar hook-length control protein FliK [Sphingomonas bacterium]MDB5677884.1 hypothetical protein [Sphingomonas bacterium]